MKSPWIQLWHFMHGSRRRYFAAIAVMALANLLAFMMPLVAKATIDGALGGQSVKAPAFILRAVESHGGWPAVARNLWVPAGLMLLLTIGWAFCAWLRGLWTARATEQIAFNLRRRLYAHLQRLPMSHFHQTDTGDLVQRCTSDVETVRAFLSTQVVEIGRAWIMLILVTPIMLWLDWRMTCIALSLVPVIILFAWLFFYRVQMRFKLVDEAEGAMTTVLQENLTGIRVVRAFARQDFETEKFGLRNDTWRARAFNLTDLLAVYWAMSEGMSILQNGINLIAGGWMVAHGLLSVGTLFAFLTLTGMLLWPVRQMGRILSELGKALVAIGRIHEILDRPVESAPAEPLPLPEPLRGAIAFRDVHFAYGSGEGAAPVLRGLDLRIEPGQTVAIVGPTGSGKSTLANLLLRLHDGYRGSITLDGLELARLDRQAVRRQVGVVMQQPFLFSKTLRENIAHGRPSALASPEEIEQAAVAACVHESIIGFEGGYETEIGERGVTLSGGQRQRVALARALLGQPPVLILDDALSAVDTETENAILAALERRAGQQTTLIITHRLSSLRLADHILVLEHGRATQFGTHAELMAQPGLYRRLWEIQGELAEDLQADLQHLS